MAEPAEGLVSRTTASLETMHVPQALHDSIELHKRHLLGLAGALLVGGHDEATVQQTIDGVFQSYKGELVTAILALREGGGDP